MAFPLPLSLLRESIARWLFKIVQKELTSEHWTLFIVIVHLIEINLETGVIYLDSGFTEHDGAATINLALNS